MSDRKTVLCVDDSRVVRKAARRILERHGFSVREAENGLLALEACRAEMPRLVLLDWNMPVMDGMQFLGVLRAEFGPDEPLVMLCTTESEFARIVLALQNGANEYIMKPFDDEIVAGKLVQLGLLEEAEP
ncbi:response regulator [Teichococcus vastitatis]|uniref:Response regulator n=1 Tax=Teichococcus vastitatis TaxID=2307076 RepID=A0ABS9W4L9_9PROT|nr:response regulator [Pseudoroseomonas vastitatis]MCI0754153.1 response regulator [Pseudoroseomonas vastitatis]